jgi:hypothetical protein
MFLQALKLVVKLYYNNRYVCMGLVSSGKMEKLFQEKIIIPHK